MTTRIIFNFEDCFAFDDDFTTFDSPDLDLVTRVTNDFVRFARHVNAMVVEEPPRREKPTDVPITRFVAISPGLKLETSYLPTLADATAYIREALKPFDADDSTLYGEDDHPPPGHYSIRLEDEVRLSVTDLRADVHALTRQVEALREALEGREPAVPTLSGSQKRAKKKSKRKKTKRKTKKKTRKKTKKKSPYAPD